MELLKGRKKFILFFLLLFVFLFLGGVVVIDYIFMGLFILFMAELFLVDQYIEGKGEFAESCKQLGYGWYGKLADIIIDKGDNLD